MVIFLPFALWLRKGSFYHLNRFYLISCIVISVLLPFLNIHDTSLLLPAQKIKHSALTYFESFPSLLPSNSSANSERIHFANAAKNYLTHGLISIGLILSSLRLSKFYFHLGRLKRMTLRTKYRRANLHIHSIDKVKAFCYFRSIYISRQMYSSKYRGVILRHEYIHFRGLHSADLLVAELIKLVTWFNPVIYLLIKHIRKNHEFIADRQSTKTEPELLQYLQSLNYFFHLKNYSTLANHLSACNLKERIKRLGATKSKGNLFAFIWIIILPMFLLMGFSEIEAYTPLKTGNRVSTSLMHPTEKMLPSGSPIEPAKVSYISLKFNQILTDPFTGQQRLHKGIDIVASAGTEVIATADGRASIASQRPGWGKVIYLQHEDGFVSIYAHLDDFNIYENEIVRKGQIIGWVGNTGRSTGPHLHYEVRKNNMSVEPITSDEYPASEN